MKKLITLLMVLVMGVSLVACGGPDKQPAVDAYNKASAAFNEVTAVINENPEAYDQGVLDTMNQMADVLNQHAKLLESGEEIDEQKLNEMIEWYGTVEAWAADVKAELDIQSDAVSE